MDRNSALLTLLIVLLASDLVGGIAPSVIIGKAKGVDVREKGQGASGAANLIRHLGLSTCLTVILIDFIKGFVCVMIPSLIFDNAMYGYFAGTACFLGDVFPAFKQYRGSRGVATAMGVAMGVDWRIAIISVGVFVLFTWATRMLTAGSLGAAFSMVLTTKFLNPYFFGFAAVICTFILIKHWKSIKRMIRHEEQPLPIFKSRKGPKIKK